MLTIVSLEFSDLGRMSQKIDKKIISMGYYMVTS